MGGNSAGRGSGAVSVCLADSAACVRRASAVAAWAIARRSIGRPSGPAEINDYSDDVERGRTTVLLRQHMVATDRCVATMLQ